MERVHQEFGDQGLVELVSAIADAEGTGRFISYATSIPHPEMPAYYAACDILVSPHVHMADGSTFFGGLESLVGTPISGRRRGTARSRSPRFPGC